jgi:hypothetical protein
MFFEFTLETQKSPNFSNLFYCQVLKILPEKTPLEVIYFVKNILEKKSYYGFPFISTKIQQKGKKV